MSGKAPIKNNVCRILQLREVEGSLPARCGANRRYMYKKVSRKHIYSLYQIRDVEDEVLRGVVLGFTRDGMHLVSYVLRRDQDIIPNHIFGGDKAIFVLIFWKFHMDSRPLTKVLEIPLFNNIPVDINTRLTIFQGTYESGVFVVHGEDITSPSLVPNGPPFLNVMTVIYDPLGYNNVKNGAANTLTFRYSVAAATTEQFLPCLCIMKSCSGVILNTIDAIYVLEWELGKLGEPKQEEDDGEMSVGEEDAVRPPTCISTPPRPSQHPLRVFDYVSPTKLLAGRSIYSPEPATSWQTCESVTILSRVHSAERDNSLVLRIRRKKMYDIEGFLTYLISSPSMPRKVMLVDYDVAIISIEETCIVLCIETLYRSRVCPKGVVSNQNVFKKRALISIDLESGATTVHSVYSPPCSAPQPSHTLPKPCARDDRAYFRAKMYVPCADEKKTCTWSNRGVLARQSIGVLKNPAFPIALIK